MPGRGQLLQKTNHFWKIGILTCQREVNFLNALVRSRLTYGCHVWRPTQSELSRINSTYRIFLRNLIHNGFKRKHNQSKNIKNSKKDNTCEDHEPELDWGMCISNAELHQITLTQTITECYQTQQANWVSHIIRIRENNNPCKTLTFYSIKTAKRGRTPNSILENAVNYSQVSKSQFIKMSFNRTFEQ